MTTYMNFARVRKRMMKNSTMHNGYEYEQMDRKMEV
jgi:hypothetical protein